MPNHLEFIGENAKSFYKADAITKETWVATLEPLYKYQSPLVTSAGFCDICPLARKGPALT